MLISIFVSDILLYLKLVLLIQKGRMQGTVGQRKSEKRPLAYKKNGFSSYGARL